jgi:hypothetical protein
MTPAFASLRPSRVPDNTGIPPGASMAICEPRKYVVPGASLRGGPRALLDRDGAALVIHVAPDDYRTDPSGNSGARLACGVVAAPR